MRPQWVQRPSRSTHMPAPVGPLNSLCGHWGCQDGEAAVEVSSRREGPSWEGTSYRSPGPLSLGPTRSSGCRVTRSGPRLRSIPRPVVGGSSRSVDDVQAATVPVTLERNELAVGRPTQPAAVQVEPERAKTQPRSHRGACCFSNFRGSDDTEGHEAVRACAPRPSWDRAPPRRASQATARRHGGVGGTRPLARSRRHRAGRPGPLGHDVHARPERQAPPAPVRDCTAYAPGVQGSHGSVAAEGGRAPDRRGRSPCVCHISDRCLDSGREGNSRDER